MSYFTSSRIGSILHFFLGLAIAVGISLCFEDTPTMTLVLAVFSWTLGGFLSDELSYRKYKAIKDKTTQPKKFYPRCTFVLFIIFVKDDEYDDFFKHFEEGFEKRRQRAGLTAARLWVWKQVFLTIGPLVWRVVRGAVAVWKLDELWKKFI